MQNRSGYRDVAPLLRPKSITLVGASENPASWPARIFQNLRAYRMSRLITKHPDINTIEINPLIFDMRDFRCVAVDVVAIKHSPTPFLS